MAPRTDGRTTHGRRTDDGPTTDEKIQTKKFRQKNSDEKIPTKKFRRNNSDEKKIGGKARGQGTAAAEARHV